MRRSLWLLSTNGDECLLLMFDYEAFIKLKTVLEDVRLMHALVLSSAK